MIRLPGFALAALAVACAGACAPPASDTAMVSNPERTAGSLPLPADLSGVTVGSVTVGRDAGMPWSSAVGPDQVRDALTRALGSQTTKGRYRLDATLLRLGRPYAGFAMTVTATIAWRLTDTTTGAVIYDKTLRSLGTATLNDAITNDNRLRIADQRAVGDNLQQLLSDLHALPLH